MMGLMPSGIENPGTSPLAVISSSTDTTCRMNLGLLLVMRAVSSAFNAPQAPWSTSVSASKNAVNRDSIISSKCSSRLTSSSRSRQMSARRAAAVRRRVTAPLISVSSSFGTMRSMPSSSRDRINDDRLALSSAAPPSASSWMVSMNVSTMSSRCLLRASPATTASEESTSALFAVKGGARSWGTTSGKMKLPFEPIICRRPSRAFSFSCTSANSGDTISSTMFGPMIEWRAANTCDAAARTSSSVSISDALTVVMSTGMYGSSCSTEHDVITSDSATHTPCRVDASSE
mmetsp:Transcript_11479/g.29357  ORF Transcript_11479/g.29357 Transcript_11479/m.29357 type:complete len:289 (+) Transcript_11479:1308-2174(+)